MNIDEFKTMIIVRLELLRGACQTPSISKKKIAESLSEFSNEIEKIKVTQ